MVDCKNSEFPTILNQKGKTLEQIIDEATNILIKDFSLGLVKFRGKEIKARYPYNDKFSYEHILKIDDPTINDKLKILRCIYAPKFKVLLEETENKSCPNFKHWKEFDTKKSQWRHIVLCEKEKIIIVLAEHKTFFVLITAYYAHYPNYIKSQIKKYNISKYKLK